MASNAAAASKATGGKKGSEGSSTMAARRLQGPRLCKPIHLECSIEGLAGGRQGRSCFEGAVAQGKATGRVHSKGAGRWPHWHTSVFCTCLLPCFAQFVQFVHTSVFCTVCTVCELRKHFSFLFSPFFEDFSAAQPFLLQQVNNQLVHDFLSQQNNRLSFSSFSYGGATRQPSAW